jgi:hypothetical protein
MEFLWSEESVKIHLLMVLEELAVEHLELIRLLRVNPSMFSF